MHLQFSYDSALLYDSIDALRVIYGDLNPGVTNVVYTNGEMDMWFPRGLQESYPGGEVINIPCKYRNAKIVSFSGYNISFFVQSMQSRQISDPYLSLMVTT